MKYLTALAAPILLALVLATVLPTPRSTDQVPANHAAHPAVEPAGRSIGAPEHMSWPAARGEGPASAVTTPASQPSDFGAPQAAASSAVFGWATYCAPTRSRCQSWGGRALLGAVPSFSYGDKSYVVTVCRATGPTRCVAVRVVSFCACGDRHGTATVIDLSPAAFRRLAPLRLGVIGVIVTAGGPDLPPTDTAPVP